MTNEKILENININLSDFALFLSVVKNPMAYRNILSIILDEPNLQLKEVHVEQVILNKSGKRAIRLDAWAEDFDERQFNMEMENSSQKDFLPKRARFYQGLIDSPILKSGSKTKYKNLPSTIIIFITQDDIFKRDLAKYTFTEKCEELDDLWLEDGTTKIFVNMSSKNGSQELVSLLQYMKDTRIDNPEIIAKDDRIVELDQIVTEVKQSEEWEVIRMSILEIGIEKGKEIGIEEGREIGIEEGREIGIELGKEEGRLEGRLEGIKGVIEACKSLGASWDKALEMVMDKFSVSSEDAEKHMKTYW